MNKYRGKYKKCRSCVYALDVHMVLVKTDDKCPKSFVLNDWNFTDKMTCEMCDSWNKRV